MTGKSLRPDDILDTSFGADPFEIIFSSVGIFIYIHYHGQGLCQRHIQIREPKAPDACCS